MIKMTIAFLTLFGIAMGYLEAAVVVYLRQIYYPEGFQFPLKIIALHGFSIEFFREISTIIILISIAFIAGKSFYMRFAYFLFCFGLWDIFYYFWLKVLLNWPPSLLTWDILFLIPVVWAGPVMAPLICAITMIVISVLIFSFQIKGLEVRIKPLEWFLLLCGSLIIFTSFIWNYGKLIIEGGFITRLHSLSSAPRFQEIISTYIPELFNWPLFFSGELLIISAIIMFYLRLSNQEHTYPEY
ncbi:MAG: hypothetical protein HXY53_10085 [Nitrospirae bacterium]|nr:hypothetical protein [Nitrospirota bacterium]